MVSWLLKSESPQVGKSERKSATVERGPLSHRTVFLSNFRSSRLSDYIQEASPYVEVTLRRTVFLSDFRSSRLSDYIQEASPVVEVTLRRTVFLSDFRSSGLSVFRTFGLNSRSRKVRNC